MRSIHLLTAVAAAALLAACGGDPGRGDLKEASTLVTTLSAAQLDAATAASGLQAISGKAKCDVRVVAINYLTPGVKGEMSNASGVVLLPSGTAAECTGPLPLLAYARGTEVSKVRTLANPTDGETALLSAVYAAQGYAVVATDYLGYAKSEHSFHPYLHADSEASAVIDSIRAARLTAVSFNANLSGKVMVSGYSQGGHSSAATHRAIEADPTLGINLVGGAHLAGPYNLSGSIRANAAIAGVQFFVPFLVTAWQKVYGNVYTSTAQAFKPPYDSYIENLLPSPTLTYTTLITTGKLPAGTPTEARDALFQSAFLAGPQSDSNPLYQAAKKNDLLDWNPKAATLLCGGAGDPTVPPALHQTVFKAALDARGVKTVTSIDVDPQIQALFGPGGKAPTDPALAAAYYGAYHGTYEPPLCAAAAKAFFDKLK